MFFKKIFAMTVVTVLCACLAHPIMAEDGKELVSPALEVIAEQCGMAKSGLVGEDIVFCAEDFERALNVSRISSLTVTSLPARTDGILYLGNSEAQVGQIITRANLPYLKFVFMNEEIKSSAVCFSTDLGAYDFRCGLFLLDYENLSPVVGGSDDAAIAVGTYQNVSVFGNLDAYDPDGDAVVYEIIEYPQEGILTLTDREAGTYRYLPTGGYTGKDTFRYVVVDRYGNYSTSAEVSINVARQSNLLVYSDLADSSSHVAAISLTEKGIMASSELDGKYYFYPSEQVTRADFLVMTMKTLGIKAPQSGEKTVFADDADISEEYRGYVNTAQKLGYVCGRISTSGELIFAPNDPITRAEAATMIYNMVSLDIPVIKPLFMDERSVPAWAKDAVYAVASAKILPHSGGYIAADSPVTRENCADMLYALSGLIK